MKKIIGVGCIAIVMSACSKPAPAPPAAAVSVVAPPSTPAKPMLSAEAYGPLKFGATLADAEKVLGERSNSPGSETIGCSYVRFTNHPNVQFMVENGIVVRADAKPGLPNAIGLDIGASSLGLAGKFPQAAITGHRYVPQGHYITLPGTGKSALVLEDDGAKITAIRGGVEPAVSYVEGCS